MNIDDFLTQVSSTNIRLSTGDTETPIPRAPETMDALFHIPLLALAIMVIARKESFRTVVLGKSVAALLVEQFVALRRVPHGLGTSLTLRRRCADALAFLESAKMVSVSQNDKRSVSLTQSGKDRLDHGSRDQGDLGLLVRQLRISQERVRARFGEE
jgi:hypothetical protein